MNRHGNIAGRIGSPGPKRRANCPMLGWICACIMVLPVIWAFTARYNDRRLMRDMIHGRIDDAKLWLKKGNAQEAVSALNDMAWWVQHHPDDKIVADGIRQVFKDHTKEVD